MTYFNNKGQIKMDIQILGENLEISVIVISKLNRTIFNEKANAVPFTSLMRYFSYTKNCMVQGKRWGLDFIQWELIRT